MVALLAAVIGVCGTLCATWLTQRNGERALTSERHAADRRLRAEALARDRERERDLRRASYIALNQSARGYFDALNAGLHELLDGSDHGARTPQMWIDDLGQARDAYQVVYAEAQLVVPDSVLTVAGTTTRQLHQAFGMLKRLGSDTARRGDSAEEVRVHLTRARGLLHDLRRDMRDDLGVTEATANGRG